MKDKNINQVLVVQNYDVKAMNKTLSEIHYNKPAYILSAAKYGTSEFEKVEKLKKEICPKCPVGNISPQHIVLDDKGKLVFFRRGELTNPDTLLKIIH
ncbi:MAG: hypothetical protein NT126_01820 [Bacteroidetes bacterium]|nr:hypothetical protein [Bacteroidota bacterium]